MRLVGPCPGNKSHYGRRTSICRERGAKEEPPFQGQSKPPGILAYPHFLTKHGSGVPKPRRRAARTRELALGFR